MSVIAKEIPSIEEIYTFNYVEGALEWDEITALGETQKVQMKSVLIQRMASIEPTDLVSIIYTSGTTGFPKGVQLSHQNFLSNIEGVYDLFPLSSADRVLSFLPLCHAYERIVNYLY